MDTGELLRRNMSAMDEFKSGTMARDGQSGGVDFDDAVGIRVFRRGGGLLGLFLRPQQLQHLRKCGNALLVRPGRNLLNRQPQQLRQGRIGLETKLRPQRALAHPAVDQRADHSARARDRPQWLGINHPG